MDLSLQDLDNSKQIDAVALDFTKAFDKVSHRHLCIKLDYYSIRGPTLDWIRNFLSGRTQQVILDGCVSDSLPVFLRGQFSGLYCFYVL